MTTLRTKIIRLAYAEPVLRDTLLPLVTKVASVPDRWVEFEGGGREMSDEIRFPAPTAKSLRFSPSLVRFILGRVVGAGLSESTDESVDDVISSSFPAGGKIQYLVSTSGLSSDRKHTGGDKLFTDPTKAAAYHRKMSEGDPNAGYRFCKIAIYQIVRKQSESVDDFLARAWKEIPQ